MDSPFKDILSTNAVPSDAECQSILEYLKGPREQSAVLTEQIARMQQSLDDLTRKRDELQSFIDAHLALVSLVRRLPDDIFREIFVAALPSDRNCIISVDEPPLLLCTVCKAWRTLALSTPRLWASLHIVASATRLEQRNSIVETWLSRSGALPLSISLILSSAAHHLTDVSILLETLIRYSSRWKHVRLKLPFIESVGGALSALSPDDVPMLEHVSVNAPPDDQRPWSAFLRAPSLRSACITHSTLPIQWHFLRHLDFDSGGGFITLSVALTILRQCLRLETLSVSVSGLHPESSYPGTPIYLEYMQELHIRILDPAGFSLFEKLVLPNLRCFEYAANDSNALWFMPLLSTASLVEYFTLHASPSGTDLVAALQLMPMLREFSLANDPLYNDNTWVELFPLLTSTAADDSILCPRLERINLKRVQALSDNMLLEFIQARTGSLLQDVAHLGSVRVQFFRPMQVDIIPPLRQLLAAGLEVSLKYDEFDFMTADRMPYSPSEGIELHGPPSRYPLSSYPQIVW